MAKTTKRPTKPRPKTNGADVELKETRQSIQRTLRAQRQIRALVGQLRRSSTATQRSLMDLHEELTSTFGARAHSHASGAAGRVDTHAGDESR